MILVPLPRLVLPTYSPLFLPRKRFHRQSIRPNRACLGDRAFAAHVPMLSTTRRSLSILGAGASMCWAMESFLVNLSNVHLSAAPKECPPHNGAIPREVGRLWPKAGDLRIRLRSKAIAHH